MRDNIPIFCGLSGFTAVALGAFGAHLLADHLDASQLSTYKTGVQYQFIHTLACMALYLFYRRSAKPAYRHTCYLFLIGIVLFSGSLYLLSCKSLLGIEGFKALGVLTPIGGLFFLMGWALFCFGSINMQKPKFKKNS